MTNVYHVTWSKDGNDLVLKVLTEDGIEYYDAPFNPYFYLNQEDWNNNTIQLVRDVDDEVMIENSGDYKKICFSDPDKLKKARVKLENNGIDCHEADIPYGRRVMIDSDIGLDRPNNILSFDIETDPRGEFTGPDDPHKRIISICAVDNQGNEYKICYDNEEKLLKEFFDIIEDYDVLVGWNSEKFDWPYVLNRARQEHNIYFDSSKIVHIDFLPIYSQLLRFNPPDFKLDTVAEFEELKGGGKFYDFEEKMEFQKLWEFFKNDKEKLLKYNLQDARVVMDLEEKYNMVDVIFLIADMGNARISDMTYKKKEEGRIEVRFSMLAIVEGKILEKCYEDNYVVEKRETGVESFTGGKVFDTKLGRHQNLVVFDFASMYPSIIKSFNIGHNTYNPDKSGEIFAPHGSFDKEPKSIIVKALDDMISLRSKFKEKKKSLPHGSEEWNKAYAKDMMLKRYCNSAYGCLGSKYGRFYKKELAEDITLVGQDLIKTVKRVAEQMGYEVVFGDTDSVGVAMGDVEHVVEKAKELRDKFNEKIKEYCAKVYNADPEPIELDMDEVYESFFVPKKAGETDSAKKKYAGFVIYDEGPCYDYHKKGLEAIRGDWPRASQEFQENLVKKILKGEDIWEYIEEVKKKLFSGELDDKIVQHVGLQQPLDEYDSVGPHVRAARELKENGEEVRVGDKIPFIKYGDNPRDVAPALNDVPDLNGRNYKYIWKKKFKSLMERLGISKYDQSALDDFA